MGKEREPGAGCRSCSLQGLTTEGHKTLKHLMPSAKGPQSGRLHPQCTTPQSRGAARDIWLHHSRGIQSALLPSHTLSRLLLPSYTTHFPNSLLSPSCPLHLSSLHFWESSQPSCIFTHSLDFISIYFSCPHQEPHLGPCQPPVCLTSQFQTLMAHPMSTRPDSLNYFIPLCPDTLFFDSLRITAP